MIISRSYGHGRTGPPGCLALAMWAVGAPARWAATSNFEGGNGTDEGAQGPLATEKGLSLDKLFAGTPEFIVTPLFMGPVCLISQGWFEEPCIRIMYYARCRHARELSYQTIINHIMPAELKISACGPTLRAECVLVCVPFIAATGLLRFCVAVLIVRILFYSAVVLFYTCIQCSNYGGGRGVPAPLIR